MLSPAAVAGMEYTPKVPLPGTGEVWHGPWFTLIFCSRMLMLAVQGLESEQAAQAEQCCEVAVPWPGLEGSGSLSGQGRKHQLWSLGGLRGQGDVAGCWR